ncbi:protein PSK SIMULATOR 1-like [Pyrus communis]|uniref:protein PSK SIMULATOR 1-like n=1 Tax=Pyrus communis TaxID=23211 RepID=UPI0035C23652
MGILEKVIRRAKVEYVDINLNSQHDSSNGPDEELDINDGIPCLPKQLAVPKVSEMSSLLGRASTSSLGRAVEAIYGLGSSMANLNTNTGFTSRATTKGSKISVLAFEVANTTVKGSNLMQSLSTYNIKHLKEVVLPSKGVQNLVSRNMDELLRIVAADKREELKILSGEVARFGNFCKDPQWHYLDRYLNQCPFSNIMVARQKLLKEDAEVVMQQLMMLVSNTHELYRELCSFDYFEQGYRCKLQEQIDNPETCQRDSLAILRAELKNRRRLVRSLKKKSFWARMVEEVVEKLVHVVLFLHKEIHHEAFSNAGTDDEPGNDSPNNHETLGTAGLALHYANIITQIDTLVSRSSSVPSNTRDTLYQGLPPGVKSALRSKLQSFQLKEEQTITEIKAETEKTLQWLVPIANNTTKAHHCSGWVGEWANTGSGMNWKPAGQTDLLRIETLHHADKNRTEAYILELVVWLHHLVNQTRVGNCGIRSPVKSPLCSPNQKAIQLCMNKTNCLSPILTVEDQEMLRYASKRKLTPGISKSQEFDTARTRFSKHNRLSKSSNHSPTSERRKDPFPIRRPSSVPIIDFDFDRSKALDVIDRVDTIRSI